MKDRRPGGSEILGAGDTVQEGLMKNSWSGQRMTLSLGCKGRGGV